LPAAKITPEISQIRGIPIGVDCVSPGHHSAFNNSVEMMRFIALLREKSNGKPIGFKICLGRPEDWFSILKAMLETRLTPDFIVVDGSEGGTGAALLEFIDHMGMPMREGLRLIHASLIGANLRSKIRLGAAGKIISAFDIARVCATGAHWCNSARGFMFAIGCIQSRIAIPRWLEWGKTKHLSNKLKVAKAYRTYSTIFIIIAGSITNVIKHRLQPRPQTSLLRDRRR
jgi:glutamate synthase domain-containing protein 2